MTLNILFSSWNNYRRNNFDNEMVSVILDYYFFGSNQNLFLLVRPDYANKRLHQLRISLLRLFLSVRVSFRVKICVFFCYLPPLPFASFFQLRPRFFEPIFAPKDAKLASLSATIKKTRHFYKHLFVSKDAVPFSASFLAPFVQMSETNLCL